MPFAKIKHRPIDKIDYPFFYAMKLRCPICAAGMRSVNLSRSTLDYCGECGYGAARARQGLRSRIIGLWGVCGVGVLLGLLAWRRGSAGGSGMALFLAAFFVLYALGRSLVCVYQLSKISRLGDVVVLPSGTVRASFSAQDAEAGWREYDRLRMRAISSLLLVAGALYTGIHAPEAMLLKLGSLSPQAQIATVFVVIGIAAVLLSAPLLQWAEWRCPRCGHKFVQPKFYLGAFTLIWILPKLVLPTSCAQCGFTRGETDLIHRA
jgi:ribosomal protein L37E